MRTSRIVTYTVAIAVTALLVGAAVYFPSSSHDVAQAPTATPPANTVMLEPVVVVATK